MNDVKINFTKQDKSLLDNLIRLLGRAKFSDLEANEILVGAESLRWLSRLQKNVEDEAKKPPLDIVSNEPIKPLDAVSSAPVAAKPARQAKRAKD